MYTWCVLDQFIWLSRALTFSRPALNGLPEHDPDNPYKKGKSGLVGQISYDRREVRGLFTEEQNNVDSRIYPITNTAFWAL